MDNHLIWESVFCLLCLDFHLLVSCCPQCLSSLLSAPLSPVSNSNYPGVRRYVSLVSLYSQSLCFSFVCGLCPPGLSGPVFLRVILLLVISCKFAATSAFCFLGYWIDFFILPLSSMSALRVQNHRSWSGLSVGCTKTTEGLSTVRTADYCDPYSFCTVFSVTYELAQWTMWF